MTRMKRVNKEKIDLSDWAIIEDKDLNAIFCRRLDEALTNALDKGDQEGSEIHADLPFEWWPRGDGRRGPRVENPLMVYVSLPLGSDDDSEPEWGVDLADMI